jgi:hypothetical protein
MTTEAATPNAAITTAPGIDEHSGVMLMTADNAEVIGDEVPGV